MNAIFLPAATTRHSDERETWFIYVDSPYDLFIFDCGPARLIGLYFSDWDFSDLLAPGPPKTSSWQH